MKYFIYPLAFVSLILSLSGSIYGQGKAQIQIRKNINGQISEENREIQLKEGQNINEILLEMGIMDEFGQLKPGQDLEIRIDKSEGPEDFQNLEFFFSPEGMEEFNLPGFAPAPHMETRPFLGVMLRQNDSNQDKQIEGALVTEVVSGSAADEAGLMAGDIITKIDKNEVSDVDDVIQYVQSKSKGDKVEITVLRNDKKKKVKAVLGEKAMAPSMGFGMPSGPESPKLNFRFGPDSITIYCPQGPNCILPNDSMKICQPFSWNGNGLAARETAFLGVTPSGEQVENGVRVNVVKESSAENMGLQDGDVIKEINGQKINSFDAISGQINQLQPGDQVNLVIERDGKQKEISGTLGKRSVSGFDDFRIFHDFKGMDEGGNYFYDYEFDMDAEDVEQRMEELLQELDIQQRNIDEERSRIENELDRLNEKRETVIIKIQIADISPEELEKVNENASPKLQTDNNISLEQISFFPNPGDGVLNLTFKTTEKKPVKILLYNNEGGLVYLEERTSFDGTYNNTIDISDEPNGTYFLQIMQEGKTYSKKIIKGK